MKKFIVDRTEIVEDKGIKYWGIFDSENNDWYEEQKNFKTDTLKIMYNKDTLQVIGTNTDVSMIAPTMAGDVVEEIPFQEVAVNPNLYLVDGKIIELKPCETIKDGKVVFNRDMRIEEIKKELKELKEAKIILGVEVKKNIYHPARDTDKINLMAKKGTIVGERDWKYYDKDGNAVIDKISNELIDLIFSKGEKVLDGAILGETKAEIALNDLSNEELQNLDVKAHFEKYYKLAGGI